MTAYGICQKRLSLPNNYNVPVVVPLTFLKLKLTLAMVWKLV